MLTTIDPSIAKASVGAITQLLTCCGLGMLATHAGLLDAPTTRALSKCVFNVFLPAMLCTSVASTVAGGAGVATLMAMPLAAVVQVGIGLLISGALLGPRKFFTPSGRDVATLSAFGNSGVLPLVFADCLFRHLPLLHARANALVAMFLLGWSPLFWTAGFSLLSPPSPADSTATDASAEHDPWLWLHRLRSRVLTPPIIGCLLGLLIGALPPLRALLVPPSTPLPLFRCLQVFGNAYSPTALLVLATSLALPARGGDDEKAAAAEDQRNRGAGARDLGVVLSTRFLLLPLAFAMLLRLARTSGLLPPDPLRDFMLTMQATMPSAQNTVLALQVAGEPSRASRMARKLLIIYLTAALPVAAVLSIALQESGLLAAAALS